MSEELNQTVETGILVTVEQLQGYEAMQKEEVGQTLALLDLISRQIQPLKSTQEVEQLFDDIFKADPARPLEDYVERRVCRAITLVGLMSRTAIPKRYVLIDEIVYKAAGILLTHQQELQAGDSDTKAVAETAVQ